nr:CD2-associated protein-like [Onthophagus taurus]
MGEMLVENDYIGQLPNELTLKKGDIVKDVIQWSPEWYKGTINNKNGLFPKSCVSTLKDSKDNVILRHHKKESGSRQCRVVFSYSQDHEDELNLKVGDVIDVLGEEEEGWWRGVLYGKEGVFPSNFVEEISQPIKIPTMGNPEKNIGSTAGEVEAKSPSLPPKPVKTLCEVKYTYKAQNDDELTLKEGDLITLISKDGVDAGWWRGELNGRVGVFPDNFVVIIPTTSTTSTMPSDEKEKEVISKPWISPDSTKPISQRSSIDSKASDISNKHPPVPAKKPNVPIKKSPSSGGGNIFQALRKTLEGIDNKKDVVDGGVGSKNKLEMSKNSNKAKREDENQNAFDQVERNSLLKDVRAGRAKPPSRRPPTNTNKEEENKEILNDDDIPHETHEIKPQVREWERHKAPWLEEMKINQAKRSSTSPGPEIRKNIEMEDVKVVPERESPQDMSKSMPALSSKRIKSPLEKIEIEKSDHHQKDHHHHHHHAIKPSIPRLKSNEASSHTDSNLSNNLNHNVNYKKSEVIGKLTELPPNNVANNGETTISFTQYIELAQKVEVLERLVEKQNEMIAQHHLMHQTQIEELRVKLSAEIKKRLILEGEFEKITLTREHLNI